MLADSADGMARCWFYFGVCLNKTEKSCLLVKPEFLWLPLGQALSKLRMWIDVALSAWSVDVTDSTVYGVCCHATG